MTNCNKSILVKEQRILKLTYRLIRITVSDQEISPKLIGHHQVKNKIETTYLFGPKYIPGYLNLFWPKYHVFLSLIMICLFIEFSKYFIFPIYLLLQKAQNIFNLFIKKYIFNKLNTYYGIIREFKTLRINIANFISKTSAWFNKHQSNQVGHSLLMITDDFCNPLNIFQVMCCFESIFFILMRD